MEIGSGAEDVEKCKNNHQIFVQYAESRVRYSKWPFVVRYGKHINKGVVTKKLECMLLAYKEKKIAYNINMNERGLDCRIIEDISFTTEISRENAQTFILDTRPIEDDCQCNDTSKMDVRKFFKGPCEAGEEICNEVNRMNTYCIEKVNNRHCTPAKCPEGQKALDGFECCYPFKQPNGTEVCCPANTVPRNIEGGNEMCCPEKGPCCREGHIFEQQLDGKDLCCPYGTEFKGVHLSEPVCCPPMTAWDDESPTYHPQEYEYRGDKTPETQAELVKVCKNVNALPVKIDNKEQNDALKTFMRNAKRFIATIGLAIPEGEQWEKDNYRWMADGSKPTWTNWLEGRPYNSEPPAVFVRFAEDGEHWVDSRSALSAVLCMDTPYEGTEKNNDYKTRPSFIAFLMKKHRDEDGLDFSNRYLVEKKNMRRKTTSRDPEATAPPKTEQK
ncbi:hypothetical protein QR680_007121 [Steinernema hermaphroditum]|uniref:C-type lectin domain-containing protein n=1 Tax=Steinernema hermaphroditum TaxID=289476 RepID=A0AA39LY99_9BILA|nr:hypothetical protein QR680_007121 [Steinernema hermaphroditum]